MKQQIALPKGTPQKPAVFLILISFFIHLNAQQVGNWEEGTVYNNGLVSDPVVSNSIAFNSTVQNHKLVMLDFFTTWCGPCAKRTPLVDEIKRAFPDSLLVIKIDAEKHSELAEQYGVSAYPTFVLLSNGIEIERDPILSISHIREVLAMIELGTDDAQFYEGENSIGFGFGEGGDCYYFNFGNAIFVTYDDQVAEIFAQKLGLVSWGKGKNLIGERYWTPPVKGNPIIQARAIGFVGSNGKIYETQDHYRQDPERVLIDPEMFGRYPANKGGGLKMIRL